MPRTRLPYFQFYPRDFLSSRAVAAMHPTARGGYVHLLCHAWLSDRPGWLPDDEKLLAALSGLGERWSDHRDSIARAWRIRKGWWVQIKLVESHRAYAKHKNSQSARGKAGAVARWAASDKMLKHSQALLGDGLASASASASALEPSQKKKQKPATKMITERHMAEAAVLYALPLETVRQLAAKIAVATDKSGKPYTNHPQTLHNWCRTEPKPAPPKLSVVDQMHAEALAREAR